LGFVDASAAATSGELSRRPHSRRRRRCQQWVPPARLHRQRTNLPHRPHLPPKNRPQAPAQCRV